MEVYELKKNQAKSLNLVPFKLEKDIQEQRLKLPRVKNHAVSLPNEDLDNWDDDFV